MMHQRQNSSFEDDIDHCKDQEEEEDNQAHHFQKTENKVVDLPKRPHWAARYIIKMVKNATTGLNLEYCGSNVYHLVQTDLGLL